MSSHRELSTRLEDNIANIVVQKLVDGLQRAVPTNHCFLQANHAEVGLKPLSHVEKIPDDSFLEQSLLNPASSSSRSSQSLIETDQIHGADDSHLGLKQSSFQHKLVLLRYLEPGEKLYIPIDKESEVFPVVGLPLRTLHIEGKFADKSTRYYRVYVCQGVLKCRSCGRLSRPPTSDSAKFRPQSGQTFKAYINEKKMDARVKGDHQLNSQFFCSYCWETACMNSTEPPRKSLFLFDHVPCSGRFTCTRDVGSPFYVFTLKVPCVQHPLPFRVRQTKEEKQMMKDAVALKTKLPLHQLDPASLVNPQLRNQRISSTRKALKKSSDQIADLASIPNTSCKVTEGSIRVIQWASYEQSLLTNAHSVLFVDSTYKVVGPGNASRSNDYRKAPQCLSSSCYHPLLKRHVVHRFMLLKPADEAAYRDFFISIFSKYSLPAATCDSPGILGFVMDFNESQLLGYITAYWTVKLSRNPSRLQDTLERKCKERDAEVFLKPLDYVKGCIVHAKRAIMRMQKHFTNAAEYRRVYDAWEVMMTTKDKRIYEMADHLLLQVAAKNQSFRVFLTWWRDSLCGSRFQILHPTKFSAAQCMIKANTNNPQEGTNYSLKHVHGLLRRNHLADAAQTLQQYFATNQKVIQLVRVGYPLQHGNLDAANQRKQRQAATKQRSKASKQAKTMYELQKYIDNQAEQQAPGVPILSSNVQAVTPRSISAAQALPWFSWRENSCAYDSVIAALLPLLQQPRMGIALSIPEASRRRRTTLLRLATHRERLSQALYDAYEIQRNWKGLISQNADPLSRHTIRKVRELSSLKDTHYEYFLRALSEEERMSELGSFQTAGGILQAFLDALVVTSESNFSYCMIPLGRSLLTEDEQEQFQQLRSRRKLPIKQKPSLLTDIIYHKKHEHLPTVFAFGFGPDVHYFSKVTTQRSIPLRFVYKQVRYRMLSVIFHKHANHFFSWILLTEQTWSHHDFTTLLPGSKRSFMGNGVWEVDAMKPPGKRFKRVIANTQLTKVLKQPGDDNLILNSDNTSVAGTKFLSRKSGSYPALAIYVKEKEDVDITAADEAAIQEQFSQCLNIVKASKQHDNLPIFIRDNIADDSLGHDDKSSKSFPRKPGQFLCFINSILLVVVHAMALLHFPTSKSSLFIKPKHKITKILLHIQQILAEGKSDAELTQSRSDLANALHNSSGLDLSGTTQQDAITFFNLLMHSLKSDGTLYVCHMSFDCLQLGVEGLCFNHGETYHYWCTSCPFKSSSSVSTKVAVQVTSNSKIRLQLPADGIRMLSKYDMCSQVNTFN